MPTEIVPDVYDITVRQDNNGRRYRAFLVDDDVPTLYDAGFESTVDVLVDGLESLDIVPERLVITHGDPDHIGGYEGICDVYDLETHVPEQTDLSGQPPATHRYGHGDVIGNFEAIHVPGHNHDLHAFVNESTEVLLAADTVAGADLRGFPEGYLLTHAAVYAEDYGEAELNLDRLLEYDFDAVVVSHGSSVSEGGYEALDEYLNFPGRPPEPIK